MLDALPAVLLREEQPTDYPAVSALITAANDPMPSNASTKAALVDMQHDDSNA